MKKYITKKVMKKFLEILDNKMANTSRKYYTNVVDNEDGSIEIYVIGFRSPLDACSLDSSKYTTKVDNRMSDAVHKVYDLCVKNYSDTYNISYPSKTSLASYGKSFTMTLKK
jgi:S-adenosylmethionine synthetase